MNEDNSGSRIILLKAEHRRENNGGPASIACITKAERIVAVNQHGEITGLPLPSRFEKFLGRLYKFQYVDCGIYCQPEGDNSHFPLNDPNLVGKRLMDLQQVKLPRSLDRVLA